MDSDKLKEQKDPKQEVIKIILSLLNSRKFNEAKKKIDKEIINFPKSSILFNILGAILSEQDQLEDAIINYKKAIKLNSNYAQAHNNLGTALHKLGKINEAVTQYKNAIDLKKDFPESLNNLGSAIIDLKKSKEAISYLEKALIIKPDYTEAYNNLGKAYQNSGDKIKAVENFQKAINIDPNYADSYYNLGSLLSDLNRFQEALDNYKKAIKLKSNNEKYYNNLGNLLNTLGRFDEATEAYNTSIKIKPDYAKAYSNLLLNLNYKTDFDINLYLSIAKKFSSSCRKNKKKISFNYNYEKEPKKLRIGFLSADFGNHPGGFFTLSTLRELRKKNFELISYATTDRRDEFSHHFKPLFSKWNLVEKKKDEEIVKQIVMDRVHILIDAQGHSSKNRLSVFFHKPAPIQASWLAQGSLGIEEIDYFIGSPHITPKVEEDHYVEKILRLPNISQCFTAPDFDVKINSLPAIKNNFITFGCINKVSKINDDVVSLWSKILISISNSKLLLKNSFFDDKKNRENIFSRFQKHKINKDRLILQGESKTRSELLKVYNEIDIALDPFPFQGNTSTCEAVWMGVPVITLKGDRYLFHFGESINSNLDMHDWIASNPEEYISKANKFSLNINQLSKIRMNLREAALNSPVFDSTLFAKNFGNLLWEMWGNFKNKK